MSKQNKIMDAMHGMLSDFGKLLANAKSVSVNGIFWHQSAVDRTSLYDNLSNNLIHWWANCPLTHCALDKLIQNSVLLS